MKPNQTEIYPQIPFVSYCGKEINFISTADRHSSLCFKDISWKSNVLYYGGSLQQEFKPELLAYNPTTGRIYHTILTHRHLRGSYGLLHPHICQMLGDFIYPSHNNREDADKCEDSVSYVLEWQGVTHSLKNVVDSVEN